MSRRTRTRAASLLAAVLALLVLGTAQAQSDRRGFLWEIRKGTQASLLFGTIHVGRPEFYPLPAARLVHMKPFDALVLEADITDTGRALSATRKYALYGSDADGLDKRLPPDILKRTEAVLARQRLDPAPMMRMKPWLLGIMLALFEATQAGYLPALSAESYLVQLARAEGKPILEFEGVEQQFELFENASWSTQIAFLDESLKAIESNEGRREINRIVQAWETGDRAGLERLLAGMEAQTSVGARFTVNSILLGRHERMAGRIESLMADGRRYLFGVGALHTVGPQGLVEMLRARGYTVTEL